MTDIVKFLEASVASEREARLKLEAVVAGLQERIDPPAAVVPRTNNTNSNNEDAGGAL